jgi:hypothetical protein
MNKNYRIILIAVLFLGLYCGQVSAQTRLINPKMNVLSNQNVENKPTSVQTEIRFSTTHHAFVATPWKIMTPAEFQALSKAEQEDALLVPEKNIVTEEDKEAVTLKIKQGKPVVNLITEQPRK